MRYWRVIKRLKIFLFSWIAFHFALGQLRRLRNYVRRVWPGADPLSESHDEAVYVHFDRRGVVHDYVVKQLEALVEAGFRTTFVTNAPEFNEDMVALVAPYCRQIVWRKNVGYDFGAYKDGIAALGDLAKIERLALMNDSVYGPLRPLSEVVAQADPAEVDVWGITDNWQWHYHIQSYFILFMKPAIASKTFQRFWRQMSYVNSKAWVIRFSEVRLTQVLTRQKMRAGVLCTYWTVARAALHALGGRPQGLTKVHAQFLDEMQESIINGTPLNPSHYFWESLLTQFGSPFLKREVILSNPLKLPYSWRWDEVVHQVSDYDTGLIHRHLQSQ